MSEWCALHSSDWMQLKKKAWTWYKGRYESAEERKNEITRLCLQFFLNIQGYWRNKYCILSLSEWLNTIDSIEGMFWQNSFFYNSGILSNWDLYFSSYHLQQLTGFPPVWRYLWSIVRIIIKLSFYNIAHNQKFWYNMRIIKNFKYVKSAHNQLCPCWILLLRET